VRGVKFIALNVREHLFLPLQFCPPPTLPLRALRRRHLTRFNLISPEEKPESPKNVDANDENDGNSCSVSAVSHPPSSLPLSPPPRRSAPRCG